MKSADSAAEANRCSILSERTKALGDGLLSEGVADELMPSAPMP
jgi:hypothetical protein